jgi:hypothetical protein
MYLHAFTACSNVRGTAKRNEKFQSPDRTGKRRRHPCPVASWKSHHDFHFHIRISAQARVLTSTSLLILVLSSSDVLPFSLLLLLTASDSFLSRQFHLPTQYIIPLTFPLRLSLMKTPRSSLLLMMSSTSLCPPSPRLPPHR